MAGTLRSLNIQSPATATPTFRRMKSPITYFSFPGSRTLGMALKLIFPISNPAVVIIASGNSQSHQEDDGGKQLPRRKTGNWTQPLLKFASSNFLPLALVSGVVLGLVNPSLGCVADRYCISKLSTFRIFIISVGAAAAAWQVGFFGLFFVVVVSLGLAIFCCIPTTLSSGVALTELAGGNSAFALVMTVISSLFGILIIYLVML